MPAWAWRFARSAALLLVLIALNFGNLPAVHAAEGKDPFVVKAAFLCNFAKFTEWPADTFKDTGAPFVIGVLGEDPFGSRLDNATKGLQLHGRQVAVRRLSSISAAQACHLVFVGNDFAKRLAEVVGALGKSPVLLIGDSRDFAAEGGMIGFLEKDGAIHFEVNLNAADGAGVKLNSGMLKLADRVHQSAKGGK